MRVNNWNNKEKKVQNLNLFLRIFCRVNEYYIENDCVISLYMDKRYLNLQFVINDNYFFNVYIIFIIDSVEPSNKFNNIR